MKRGVYILSNDKVYDQTVAFLNSLRANDPVIPLVLIPFNDDIARVTELMDSDPAGSIFPDTDLIRRQDAAMRDILGRKWPRAVNRHRTHLCWFGPLEQFIYIDVDIVLFKKVSEVLSYLSEKDLIWCDYQFKSGIKFVFSDKALRSGFISREDIRYLFNGGMWGSKSGLFSYENYLDVIRFYSKNRDLLDLGSGGSDQPLLNAMSLELIDNDKKLNLTQIPDSPYASGNWAGSGHFREKNGKLIDPNSDKELFFLHWAGINIAQGCPYWEVWKRYRDMDLKNDK